MNQTRRRNGGKMTERASTIIIFPSHHIIIMSEPLSTGQKIFNQRLLAEHCLTERQAEALYEELQQTYADLEEFPSLIDCIKSANAQLQYLGLEIVAIAMPASASDADENDEDEDESENSHSNKKSKRASMTTSTVRHYAMVNKFPDDIAKQTFQAAIFQPPSQQAYVKAVLEMLVQDRATARSTLLNLKNTVSSAESKVTLSEAQDALERLLEEKWLTETTTKSATNKAHRRGSNAAQVQLGPRAYCELSYLLTEEFGMDQESMPQQIVLRM
jgi:hypothetical protein